MRRKTNTNVINMLLLVGAILLLFEFLFDNHGRVIFLGITGACIYAGRKKFYSTAGKLLFWFGVFFFAITLLQTFALKFLLFTSIIYFLYRYSKSKKEPRVISPKVIQADYEKVIKKTAFFKNRLFGRDKTPDHVYEWRDINIQAGFGDTLIDLGNTVLPKGEAVIVIRKWVGNIQILIPYEVEVNLNHSVLNGSLEVFDHSEPGTFNQNLQYQTADYEKAAVKVKIVTSVLAGDLEVKRV
ncbi:cell wall-active antibiotics response protein LiaF [Metabacillus sp. RGM 3146]|uniref:cell wall-active antibiotics response protein LiaF n=1 Tax=Metabacillus sp. RGM 3146 TaxID=3401092 RepID=UPI003B9D71F3